MTIIDAAIDTDKVAERTVGDWVYINNYQAIRHKSRCDLFDPDPQPEPDPEPDPNACSAGSFTDSQVEGSSLHVTGDVAADAGLLRYSLVVDANLKTLYSEDYTDPLPTSDSFDLDLSLAGKPYTLGQSLPEFCSTVRCHARFQHFVA